MISVLFVANFLPLILGSLSLFLAVGNFNLAAQAETPGGDYVDRQLPLAAEVNAAGAITPNGFSVDVIVAEPTLQQPIAFTWDRQGRLYVAECLTYAEGRLNYDLRESDRIAVFSDGDRNGTFESRAVFTDDLKRLTSVAVGFGGVWALTPPTLVFIPDADGDLKPDGPATVKLDGFASGSIRHNIANGLKWGPDGWLYGRHGIMGTSLIGRPGTPEEKRLRMNTGFWRFHPQTEKVEAWIRGGTNSWGHDWNKDGELFYINTVIGHFWHGIPSAYTLRMYGQHDRPHLYKLLDMHADHWHFDIEGDWKNTREDVDAEDAFGGGHAHTGLMIYQADKWPEVYRNQVFTLNFHGRRINRESLHREGSGYVASHLPDFIKFPDRWFRGIDIMQGPDGDAYLLDWSDTGECHDNDAVHRGSGRLYRVRYGDPGTPPQSIPDDIEAIERWLRHPNVWYSRKAILLLHELRASRLLPGAWVENLRKGFENAPDESLAVRYFHAWQATGDLPHASLLTHPFESIRVMAIYALRDAVSVSDAAVETLKLLSNSGSSRVRLAIATLLPRLPGEVRLTLASNLSSHGREAKDHNYSTLLWHNIEPLVGRAEASSLRQILDACALDDIRRWIIRRLAEDYEPNRLLLSHLLLRQPDHIKPHLSGLSEALQGVRRATPLPGWEKISSLGADHPDIQQLGAIFGQGRSLKRLFQLAEDENEPIEARRRAIRSLANSDYPDLKAHLLRWMAREGLAAVSAAALAQFPDDSIGQSIIERLDDMRTGERAATMEVVVTRANWAKLLLERILDNHLPKALLTSAQARQIANFPDPEIKQLLADAWGTFNPIENDPASQDLAEKMRRLAQPPLLAAADKRAGRILYEQLCSSCHLLYGEGSPIGPDLTGSGRNEIEYLIENLLHPSAIVPSGYRLSTVHLKDGRALGGVITAQSDGKIALQMIGQDPARQIPRSEIESIDTSTQSFMPPGLLNPLDDKQLTDFLSYLMGSHQY